MIVVKLLCEKYIFKDLWCLKNNGERVSSFQSGKFFADKVSVSLLESWRTHEKRELWCFTIYIVEP